jgi:hypothetical protein
MDAHQASRCATGGALLRGVCHVHHETTPPDSRNGLRAARQLGRVHRNLQAACALDAYWRMVQRQFQLEDNLLLPQRRQRCPPAPGDGPSPRIPRDFPPTPHSRIATNAALRENLRRRGTCCASPPTEIAAAQHERGQQHHRQGHRPQSGRRDHSSPTTPRTTTPRPAKRDGLVVVAPPIPPPAPTNCSARSSAPSAPHARHRHHPRHQHHGHSLPRAPGGRTGPPQKHLDAPRWRAELRLPRR